MSQLEDLRRELADLSSRVTKFAITSLVILTIVSLTFGRALRTVDSEAVNALVEHAWKLVNEEDNPDAARGLREALAKLSDSFEVDLPISGAKLKINLLYWSGALPFFVLFSFAYLVVMAAKVRAVRIIAVSRIAAGDATTTIDRLFFDDASAYSRYPGRMTSAVYAGLVLLLVGNVVVAIAQTFGSEAAGFSLDPIRQLLILSFYLLCLTLGVRRRILAEARMIAGEAPTERRRWLQRMREDFSARATRWWRQVAFGGSGLTLLTLFIATTSTTSCESEPRTGAQLFLAKDGAVWPLVEAFAVKPIFRIDSLGRFVYIAAVLFAGLALAFVTLTLVPRIARWMARQGWVWDGMRSLAVTLFFFMVCEFGFVWFPFGLPARIPPLWELAYWVIPAGLYVWMTVIRRRRWIDRWRSRTRRTIWLLYAPALIVAPLAMLWFERIGIVALFAGLAALATAFTCAPAAIPVMAPQRSDAPLQVASSAPSDQTV